MRAINYLWFLLFVAACVVMVHQHKYEAAVVCGAGVIMAAVSTKN